ncbi:GAF domain-containing protein [Micromonospora sp. NPDC004540]|uniref:GAF domain-containing protein n=1 Tax=Micromonospora sp. NPDC004540 TaxID=3154457 RepID=UPI0033A5E05E
MPDLALDRFARMVAKVIGVPVALVSLVDDVRQYFPGAAGLGLPWMTTRHIPLSHSLCQRVVTSAKPLVITDARGDDRVCDTPAIEDLGVVGYAGMPLFDDEGNTLGSLCAIDTSPRIWSDAELDLLADLAAACSAKLRLRIIAGRAQRELEARVAAQSAVERLSDRLTLAFDRSQVLLSASTTLADTETFDDIVAAVRNLVSRAFDPSYVGLLVREERRIGLIGSSDVPPAVAAWLPTSLSDRLPAADAVRSGTPSSWVTGHRFLPVTPIWPTQ